MFLFRNSLLKSFTSVETVFGARYTAQRSYSSVGQLSKEDINDEAEHATGLEKKEIVLEEQEGKNIFGPSKLTGPFGTLTEPVVVPSVFKERIVGCLGSDDHPHDIKWHNVGDKDTICTHCGQVFHLDYNPDHY
eukprot:CAMPEP_0201546122 /NCGR_PEP_ID=MMETSP0173_2-20130828/2511_1 /ASSEMBLY_ACC=CAM_ASM_000268 /TAXON_ID=218659 /ORGANISM="Vexillifera sp., Strain DIVA3 564/2" /LENGTH=133 /DNA_ID=CAMNT_0047954719 /DNA_START=9 /DNA_END=410 /DNA_ORIENTATION=-